MNTERVLAEHDFLLARARTEHLRIRPSDVGLSSQAMLLYALGALDRPRVPGWSQKQLQDGSAGSATMWPSSTTPAQLSVLSSACWVGTECGDDYPRDPGDLDRCERTYAAAPPHLQERMLPVLEEFRAWVRHGTNRHGYTPRKNEEAIP